MFFLPNRHVNQKAGPKGGLRVCCSSCWLHYWEVMNQDVFVMSSLLSII